MKARIKMSYIFLFMATAVFMSITAHSESSYTPEEFKDVRALIQNHIDHKGVVSITIAVAKDGEILWEQGFGWAD